MEELIAQLRSLNEGVSLPLDLPTEEQVLEAEEQILMPLPADLRTYLLQASDVITGNVEPVTVADERSHTYLPELAALAWDRGLPREYIPVCEYDGGYACIAQDGVVYFWLDGNLEQEWQDLWAWVREVWLHAEH